MIGEIYKIGTLTRTHGVRGEISISFTDDVWDRVEADYLFLMVDGLPVPFFLEEWRFRNDTTALLKFQGIDDAVRAQEFVGCDVYFPQELTPEPDESTIYTWRQFTGWKVEDRNAGNIGVIDKVDDSTANTIFEIDGILIPAAEPLIECVDPKTRTICMKIPEGLLEQ